MARFAGWWLALGLLLVAGFALGGALAQDERPRRLVNVSLQDEGCGQPDRFCVEPASITLEEGTDLVLRVTNDGRVEHNLTFGPEAPAALANQSMNGTLAVDETQRMRIPWPAFEEGLGEETNATLHCGREGHAQLGERLTIQVPSLAASDERPQPAPGTWAGLAVLGVVAVALGRDR
jgi:hypothetical protein